MKKPEPGDLLLTKYGPDTVGAVVSRVREEDDEKYGVTCSILTISNVIDSRAGIVYETEDEALENSNPPSVYTFWVKPDPVKKLIEDLTSALLSYDSDN